MGGKSESDRTKPHRLPLLSPPSPMYVLSFRTVSPYLQSIVSMLIRFLFVNDGLEIEYLISLLTRIKSLASWSYEQVRFGSKRCNQSSDITCKLCIMHMKEQLTLVCCHFDCLNTILATLIFVLATWTAVMDVQMSLKNKNKCSYPLILDGVWMFLWWCDRMRMSTCIYRHKLRVLPIKKFLSLSLLL